MRKFLLGGIASLFAAATAFADSPGLVFSVSVDQTTSIPTTMKYIPDEHTSFLPLAGSQQSILFVTGTNTVSGTDYGGTFALTTPDLIHFEFASGYGDPTHGNAVFYSQDKFADCNFASSLGQGTFDQNYAGSGSIFQDPTRPAGNLLMIYEAENHCPGGAGSKGENQFWASIGLTRSSDGGKSWPAPGSSARYPVLQVQGPQPSTSHPNWGDALPSAFIDDVVPSAHPYLYVVYTNTGSPTVSGSAKVQVARAQLGGSDPLVFTKWNNGWSGAGIGGLDSGVTSKIGCGNPVLPAGVDLGGQISYNDDLHVYMLTFTCQNLVSGSAVQGGWYFSTATSLETQDWTEPELIENSQYPTTTCTSGAGFDGGYPTFLSPGHAPGHLGKTGKAFLMDGCGLTLQRSYNWRTFEIVPTRRRAAKH